MNNKQRIFLENQVLPNYSKGEEIFNLASHAFGGFVAIIMMTLAVQAAIIKNLSMIEILSLVVYGFSAIALYTISSIYHGLNEDLIAKKIFRIIDHCTIYLLIAGTYTPICMIRLISSYQGNIILALQWSLAIVGIVLNALWLNNKAVKIISIILYIALGWMIVFVPGSIDMLEFKEFLFILLGGLVYSIGVIFYGMGKNIKWAHSIFHIFCVVATILQFIGIYMMII